jgi:hypothetical protein
VRELVRDACEHDEALEQDPRILGVLHRWAALVGYVLYELVELPGHDHGVFRRLGRERGSPARLAAHRIGGDVLSTLLTLDGDDLAGHQ